MPTARLLIVPQTGRLRFWTEFGVIDVEPGEICVIQRGVIFRTELIDGPARAYVCENYGGALPVAGPRPDRRQLSRQCARLPHAGGGLRGQGGALDALRQMGRRTLCRRDRPVAARRRRLARQLRALQVRPAAVLAGRRADVRSPRPVDLHRDDGAVGNAGHRQHRPRDLPRALGGGGEHLPPAVVPPQPDVGIHGADLRRLRRQAGRLRAGRHVAAQLHAAARPRRAGVRARQHRGAQADQARQHHGVHVRDPLSAAPDRLCGRAERTAGRLPRLLARLAQALQPGQPAD